MSTFTGRRRTVKSSWTTQSLSVRAVRLFLGVTWIYAGWYKASDSGFLTKGAPTYIGTQLSAYATSSPVGFLFNHLIERAVPIGIFVMASELAIGIATLLWIAPTSAAFGGFAMSVGLWLASSFHVSPYFLASDTAYAILWLSYLLTLIGKRRALELSLDRRGAIRVAMVGAIAIATAGVTTALSKGSARDLAPKASGSRQIIEIAKLPINASHDFVAKSGTPAVLFRTNTGVFAYSAICTHQGCTVAYAADAKVLQCPCHGASFDPFKEAAVVGGPALTPLEKISVKISGAWVIQA